MVTGTLGMVRPVYFVPYTTSSLPKPKASPVILAIWPNLDLSAKATSSPLALDTFLFNLLDWLSVNPPWFWAFFLSLATLLAALLCFLLFLPLIIFIPSAGTCWLTSTATSKASTLSGFTTTSSTVSTTGYAEASRVSYLSSRLFLEFF